VGLERGALSLVRKIEELFQGNSGCGLEKPKLTTVEDSLRWPRDTLYPPKLALCMYKGWASTALAPQPTVVYCEVSTNFADKWRRSLRRYSSHLQTQVTEFVIYTLYCWCTDCPFLYYTSAFVHLTTGFSKVWLLNCSSAPVWICYGVFEDTWKTLQSIGSYTVPFKFLQQNSIGHYFHVRSHSYSYIKSKLNS
jgi:hypothetical protein